VRIGEVPATDQKLLIGRIVETSVAELTGDMKNPSRLKFRVSSVSNRDAHTVFSGYSLAREHAARLVRKRNDRVDLFVTVKTKDRWELQVSTLLIMNRNTYRKIQSSARRLAASIIAEAASKMTMEDFISSVALERKLQSAIRSAGNKIYPIRHAEITKIEILSAPAN